MSEVAIFLVGIVIFAITIYGAVMAGGVALTKVMVDQQPRSRAAAGDRSPAPTSPDGERRR